ncbi:hypothetical protein KEM09_21490 [Carboxylicivirga mesophila]|uniref:Uncharacterized protein n=1 Tax=Carboxylicivirga mesophila TaxID=1166478 RepID=A0ABS5KGY2_9BACT|nr:hypothetical protein [Carboxylicivirga mesophila]MBS2213997.1 hypothetical protein [Carboxylicivirga mesophila]
MNILFSAFKKQLKFTLIMILIGAGLFSILGSINLFAEEKVKKGIIENVDITDNEIKIKLFNDKLEYYASPNNYEILDICDTTLIRENNEAEIIYIQRSLIANVIIENKYAIKKGVLYKDHVYSIIGFPIIWIVVFVFYRQFVKYNN